MVETSNVITILMYFRIRVISVDEILIPLLICSCLIVFNSIRFLSGTRYELINKVYKEKKPKYNVLGTTVVIVYTILSFFTFSSQFIK